ncbi:MAG: alpha/beta hydrolase [SAR324 cluster bacterium]|nr:alpha/beta hydrolase [SAR324 cluster bacterium]
MPEFDTGTYRLHYQWGRPYRPGRPTVVLLHDGLGAIGSWRGLPARLARVLEANTLVYDRFGYGRSQARPSFPHRFMEAEVAPLRALLDHVGADHTCLVGHSDGGSIALLFAARYRRSVRALVTEAAHAFVEPETQAGIRALVAMQAAGKTPTWLRKLHGERAEALLGAWSERWLSDSHARWSIRERLPAVRCPVLAIQGEADEFGTQGQVDAILLHVPSAQSWIVPGCGHTPHNQAEDAFVERVVAFLQPHLRD